MDKQQKDLLPALFQVVEQSATSIIITDADGRIIYVNPQFTKVTGYSREEAIGKNPRILKSGHVPPEQYRDLWETISSGRVWRGKFHNRRKDGSLFWETGVIVPVLDNNGRVTHHMAVKNNSANVPDPLYNLEIRNYRLEAVDQILQTVSATLDLDHILQMTTDKIASLLNVPVASIWLTHEQTGNLVCHSASGPYRELLLGREIPPGKGVAGQAIARGESINESDLQNNPHYIRNAENEAGVKMRSALFIPLRTVTGALGVITLTSPQPAWFQAEDIVLVEAVAAAAAGAIEKARLHQNLRRQYEKQKEMKTRLVQTEKLAAIGELVAGVTHELNNPLTSIILYSQFLEKHLEKQTIDQTARSSLEKIVEQAQRASQIIQRLLDFSRQRPSQNEPTDINDLLERTVELLSYELRIHNIDTETSLAGNLPLTMVDPQQIQQVFINLILNAVQAMSEANGGGALTLKTEQRRNEQEEDVIRITVQDNGPGIARQLQPRIFDPFFTTKAQGKGTGLGLSVCHGIVSQHNGRIWAESKAGQGAVFFVELPVTPPEAAARPAAKPADQPETPAGRRRILVVDDESSITAVLTQILYRNGYAADGALNGPAALERLAQTEYDLVICDLRMPDMGGGEVYKLAIEQRPSLADRFIFTTGDITRLETGLLPSPKSDWYLQKPFDKQKLLQTIRRRLQSIKTSNEQ